MNNLSSTTINAITNKYFYIVTVLMLFCVNANAQSTQKSTDNSNYATSTEMELVLWFVGTKQSKSTDSFKEGEVKSHKKEIIESGITPNRILTRTFLHKAMNYENSLV